METMHIQQFCQSLRKRREERRLPNAGALWRGLVEAMAADVQEVPEYDASADMRVRWALAILEGRGKGVLVPFATPALEHIVGLLLDEGSIFSLSGKEAAAGERRIA